MFLFLSVKLNECLLKMTKAHQNYPIYCRTLYYVCMCVCVFWKGLEGNIRQLQCSFFNVVLIKALIVRRNVSCAPNSI